MPYIDKGVSVEQHINRASTVIKVLGRKDIERRALKIELALGIIGHKLAHLTWPRRQSRKLKQNATVIRKRIHNRFNKHLWTCYVGPPNV